MIKFIIFLLATVVVCAVSGKWVFLPFCIAELLLLFAASASLAKKAPKAGYILNIVLLFIYSAQLFIYHFTGEFISLLMLENMNMTASLGDSMVTYVLTAIPFIGLLFLPAKLPSKVLCKKILWLTLFVVYLASSVTYVSLKHVAVSPYTASFNLCTQLASSVKTKISDEEKQRLLEYFCNDSIPGTTSLLEETLPENPNIILFLTEGLSAEVLDVYNDHGRNLTPNLNALHSRSVVFDNYFNHTAATFRALRGQLYSGYQNLGGYYGDGNGLGQVSTETLQEKMAVSTISLYDILNDCGYNTCYLNCEPGSEQICAYAASYGADTLVCGNYPGLDRLSDRQTFETLASTVLEYHHKEEPYFIMVYNLGTHHGFDSPDVKYADGSDPDLNKFHNYDYWFGDFFEKMNEAGVWDNTLLVFSADHASYPAPEYRKTFQTDREEFVSSIPLFFYHSGVTPARYDVGGRNSLDLAPTILDLLDKQSYVNYFLGTSLFCEPESELSYMSAIGSIFYCSKGGKLVHVSKRDRRAEEIMSYYKINMN